MPRLLRCIALGAVLLGGAATPALAQSPASARQHLFVASLKADVVTTWEEPSWRNDGCQVRTVAEASGAETTRIRTTPIRVRVLAAGKDAAIAYGPLRKPVGGLPGKGSVKAEHAIFADHSPGACAFDGYAPADIDDQHGCEDGHMQWTVQMLSVKGRLAPAPLQQRAPEAMDNCTIYRPSEASSAWMRSGIRVPMSEIRNRDQEYVVLRGRSLTRETIILDEATTIILDEATDHFRKLSTTVRWTLRMRRAT